MNYSLRLSALPHALLIKSNYSSDSQIKRQSVARAQSRPKIFMEAIWARTGFVYPNELMSVNSIKMYWKTTTFVTHFEP